ncbi:ribonuclease H-like domain-containing protein [Tanacetum coccineum]|uniref:Ribonuclease H-like domain-containing protein n=1 Tax=Tanacetum coccineum TaxID=301880 RepID=A0ABQ5BX96_9ASTR
MSVGNGGGCCDPREDGVVIVAAWTGGGGCVGSGDDDVVYVLNALEVRYAFSECGLLSNLQAIAPSPSFDVNSSKSDLGRWIVNVGVRMARLATIGSKWIYRIKYKASGEIDRYKDRLVAQGFGQREGLDYEETFSPVDVYMALPPGLYDKNETKVCKLVKSLYGLKQAPRQWNAKLTSSLIENGFIQSKNDYSLYVKSKKGLFVALLVYVDDIVVTETKNDKFLPSMIEYQKLVGKLIYLSVTRPDIAYVVHCLSRHMHAPLQSHFSAGLRVLRYLKQAPGFCVYFCNNLVSWKSKKQATISRSSAESEYRCLASTACEVIWIAKILKDLDIESLFPVDLYCALFLR